MIPRTKQDFIWEVMRAAQWCSGWYPVLTMGRLVHIIDGSFLHFLPILIYSKLSPGVTEYVVLWSCNGLTPCPGCAVNLPIGGWDWLQKPHDPKRDTTHTEIGR